MATPENIKPPGSTPDRSYTLRPGWILALVCLPIFIGALDLTIVSAVLPTILADLKIPYQTGLDDAVWVVSGYLLAYTISMTFMGRVSDIWGRRRVYIICLSVFIFGSILVAVAPGAPADFAYRIARAISSSRPDRAFMALYALIFGRVVQALGAGALVPVSMALVGDIYPSKKRAMALGVIGGVDTAGWVLGHLYGGIMVQYLAWPILFWLNVPLAGVALGLTAWALRGLPKTRAEGRLDWAGAVLIAISLTGLNLALNTGIDASLGLSLNQMQNTPAFSPALLLVAALSLVAFVFVERRSSSPLLNLNAYRERNFSVASIVNLLIGFSLMAGLVSVPIYMNTVPTVSYGLDLDQAALLAGYLLSALTLPMAFTSLVGGWLTGKLGYRWTTVLGAALALIGFGVMSRWTEYQSEPVVALFGAGLSNLFRNPDHLLGTWRMAAGLVAAGAGIGLTISPIATAVINSVSAAERGVASALVIVMRLIGMTVSISILTTYGLRRSRALLAEGLEGVDLTDFATQAAVLVKSTTKVIDEMALITGFVCLGALVIALLLRNKD